MINSLDKKRWPHQVFKTFVKGFYQIVIRSRDRRRCLPIERTQGFDRNAYKLITKLGFGHQNVSTLRKLPQEIEEENPYELTNTQKMQKDKIFKIKNLRVGTMFTYTLVHISIKR